MPLKLKRSGRYGADKLFTAHIKLLDNVVIDINLPLSSKGKDCLEKIAVKLGLREVDYFGLQFLTKKEKLRWVELDKCLRKQLDRYAAQKGRDALLVFKVQFFAVTLETLKQEITRYLYYLQLKSHILHSKLKCDINLCLKLAGLAVQAEFGDHDPTIHSLDYLSDFHLLPNELLDSTSFVDLNKEIIEAHKQNQGLDPASAERKYIELCQQLEHYGVEYFDGKDKENIPVQIGSSYQGIKLIYPGKEKSNCLLRWQDVGKMAFNRQQFVVVSIKTGETLSTQMDDMETSKYLWKLCVGQHQFFRMSRNTIGKNAFRTQFEVATDPGVFMKSMHQNTPQINRRVTLTKRKAKEKKSARSDTSSVRSNSLSESGLANGVIPYPYVDDYMDDTEFLHRYEDICNLGHDTSRGSSFTSSGSTNASNASSEYATSDSDSEADHRQFYVQPMCLNGPMETRPVSLIFTRLNKIENEHRDELLKHLQGINNSGDWKTEFDQVFRRKNGADFAAAMENTAGNRVQDVLPYEDNRIHLNPNNNFEATSYINASSIKMSIGSNHNLSFIVAQSPLKHTVSNFWQMIWEHNVTVVAVLSKLQENGREVCWQYWPDDSDEKNIATFGQVTVRKRFDNHFASYSIRSLHVQHASDSRPRTIFQLQFLQWPEDGSVPSITKPFIEYLDEIQSIRKVAKDMNRHLPHQETLIHCEDGAGRSGVVVLSEVLLGGIEHNQSMDVPMTLARLRSQRTNFVQTSHQYKFVYQLLTDYLKRNRLI